MTLRNIERNRIPHSPAVLPHPNTADINTLNARVMDKLNAHGWPSDTFLVQVPSEMAGLQFADKLKNRLAPHFASMGIQLRVTHHIVDFSRGYFVRVAFNVDRAKASGEVKKLLDDGRATVINCFLSSLEAQKSEGYTFGEVQYPVATETDWTHFSALVKNEIEPELRNKGFRLLRSTFVQGLAGNYVRYGWQLIQ